MLKKILVTLGLRAAPPPVQSYFAVSSLFGVVPALAFVGWKYRHKIAPLFRRATQGASSIGGSEQSASLPAA